MMNSLLVLASVLAYASAGVILPSMIPSIQYHGQDLVGGYSYGYATPEIESKTQVRQFDSAVLSGYKYVDGYGQIQQVEYKADPKLGLHVATNLPINLIQDTPEVAQAKKEHLKAVEIAKMQLQHQVIIPQVGYSEAVRPVIPKTVDMGVVLAEQEKKKEIMETAEVTKAKEEHLKAVEKELMLHKQQEKLVSEAKFKTNIKSDIYTPVYSWKSDYVQMLNGQPIVPIIKSDYVPLVKSEPIVPFVKSDLISAVKTESIPVVKTEPIVPGVKSVFPLVKNVVPVVRSDILSHQYHSQDELGRFAYSYDDINSAKVESGIAGKDVSGQYSYVDANSKLQTVRYTADDQGFRVAATNLPVHGVFSGDSLIRDANKYQIAYY